MGLQKTVNPLAHAYVGSNPTPSMTLCVLWASWTEDHRRQFRPVRHTDRALSCRDGARSPAGCPFLAAGAAVRSHGLSCTNRPFEFEFGLQAFPVTADRRNGEFPAVAPEADRAIVSGRIAIDIEPIPLLGMTDIVRWSCRNAGSRRRAPRRSVRCRPSMLRAATWPWRSATTQCSTRILLPGQPIRPAGDVPGGVNARRAGLQELVHHHAAIDGKPGLLRERHRRTHADADDDQIGIEPFAGRERHETFRDRSHGRAEMEDDPMRLVDRAHHVAECRRP